MTGTVVLGAGGFIGQAIMRALGHEGMPLTREDLDLVDATSVKAALTSRLASAGLIYCAGVHRQRSDSVETLLDNQRMIENVISAMEEAPPSAVVFASSVEVYGAPKDLPVTEETPLRPIYRYAAGKVACELLLRRHCDRAGIPLSIVRLPGVYGPADNGISIVSRIVAAAMGGQPFRLMGSGATRRDYIYVDDVARALIRLADDRTDGLINLATGRDLSLAQLIDTVTSLIGPCQLETAPAAPGDFDLKFDITGMNELLPGFQTLTVEDGLSRYRGIQP